MKPKVDRPLPPDMERIPLDGFDPKRFYVLHRLKSRMYKLYADERNIALYYDDFQFVVFPAYNSAHECVLKAFMNMYIPDSPLEVTDFKPGRSRAFTDLHYNPKEVR